MEMPLKNGLRSRLVAQTFTSLTYTKDEGRSQSALSCVCALFIVSFPNIRIRILPMIVALHRFSPLCTNNGSKTLKSHAVPAISQSGDRSKLISPNLTRSCSKKKPISMVETRKQHGITIPRRQFDSASTTGNSPKKRKKRELSHREQAGLDSPPFSMRRSKPLLLTTIVHSPLRYLHS
jgi:hypothetical protein